MKIILKILQYSCLVLWLYGGVGVSFIALPCAIYYYFIEGLTGFVLWCFIGNLGILGIYLFKMIEDRL